MEKSGLNKNRLQLLWASAAEGERFASKIREIESIVAGIKRKEINKGKEVFEKTLGGN